jgi:hypothetical protein
MLRHAYGRVISVSLMNDHNAGEKMVTDSIRAHHANYFKPIE